MKCKRLLLMSLAIATLCFANNLPYVRERTVLDRLFDVAAGRSVLSHGALAVLKDVALARKVSVTPELENQVGAKSGELGRPEFQDTYVREHALRNIGRVAVPEAIDFLSKLTPGDLLPDDSRGLWPAAQIALMEAILSGIADRQEKIDFLEKTVKNPPADAACRGQVLAWAVHELCNSGIATSLPLIEEALRKRGSGWIERLEFCEARIQVVQSNPDVAKALGSALRIDGPVDSKLTQWAIYRLAAMGTPQANAELDRFAADIAKIPGDSSRKQPLNWIRQDILSLRDMQNNPKLRGLRIAE